MILYSPFADLTQLVKEMVEKGRKKGITVPNIIVSVVPLNDKEYIGEDNFKIAAGPPFL